MCRCVSADCFPGGVGAGRGVGGFDSSPCPSSKPPPEVVDKKSPTTTQEIADPAVFRETQPLFAPWALPFAATDGLLLKIGGVGFLWFLVSFAAFYYKTPPHGQTTLENPLFVRGVNCLK